MYMFKVIVMRLVMSFQLTLLPENYNVVRHGFVVIAYSAIWNRKIYIWKVILRTYLEI